MTYTDLAEGPHRFSVSVTDPAGNTGSASHDWTIDIPPVLDHIVISPRAASIEVGGSQAYTAEAFDTDGGSMGDVTEETSFSIGPDGSCTGATCSASELGEHTVTGTYQGSSDTAVLTVVPPLDHIVISPGQAAIKLGESQAYTAEAFEADGDSLGDVTEQTSFSIDPSGSCSNATCTASEPGTYTRDRHLPRRERHRAASDRRPAGRVPGVLRAARTREGRRVVLDQGRRGR